MYLFKRGLGLVGILAVVSTMLVISAPSAAAASCSPAQNLQVGYSTVYWPHAQSMRYEGAMASILDRGGYVLCTTDPSPGVNFSTSWVMIQGGNGYAQSGTMYRWGYGTCVKRWAEQAAPGGGFQDFYVGGCSNVGETHRYWEQSYYTGSAWVIRSNIDTTVIRQSTFSPYSWSGTLNVTFFSETYHEESNVPGSASSRQDWSLMQVQNYANDGWYTTCSNANMGVGNSNATSWGVGAPGCNHIQSWTK